MHYGIDYGNFNGMRAAGNKKITVHVPPELLARARETTRAGTTETVRRGLELLAAKRAYTKLSELRGKLDLAIDISALRKDRD